MSARRLLFALGVLLACGFSSPAAAQSSEALLSDDSLEVATTVPLPRAMQAGWVPVRVEARNLRDERLRTELTFSSGNRWDLRAESVMPLELEPKEVRQFEVLIPSFGNRFGESIYLRAEHFGRTTSTTIHAVESSSSNESTVPLLLVDGSGFRMLERFQGVNLQKTGPDPVHSHTVRRTTALQGAGVLAEDLPTDWRAYTTLSVVAINLDAPLPERAAMNAILQWVDLGGSLVLFNGDEARAESLLAAGGVRFQERLELPTEDGQRAFRQGMGRLIWEPELRRRFDASALTGAANGVFPDVFLRLPPSLPGVGLPPLSLLTTLLIVVALIMGPIQFAQMKKRRAKPWRFLQVTPLLGIGFAFAILVVSLVSQGLSVRESVHSLTVLDQERRVASTVVSRTTFSGSLLAQRQRYGADSLTVPSPTTASTLNEAIFEIDLARGNQLGGAFLPTRVPMASAAASSRAARSGLRLEREGDALYAVNDLDVGLSRLRLVDGEGRAYEPESGSDLIGPGARVRMLEVEKLFDVLLPRATDLEPFEVIENLVQVDDAQQGFGPRQVRHLPQVLPRRSWMAQVERSPFVPDGDVRRKEEHASHLIIGLLEEEGS